ncbi:MAG: hypothetical protein HGA71_12645 [Azonexaceae bacterium]|nr:hypothetical protein [Azonexaceae bacterium]
MGTTTVSQFANELKMSIDVLEEQLAKAGVVKADASAELTDHEKSMLLDHLRRARVSTRAVAVESGTKRVLVKRNPSNEKNSSANAPKEKSTYGGGRLTEEQRQFIDSQKIPMSRVFDATGLSRQQYRKEMKELDMVLAYGVGPCRNGGHTIKTRSGHCPQCKTANIAFSLRYDTPGQIYVAWSPKGKLTKVGTAQCASARLPNLNSYQYGGVSDWQVVFKRSIQTAGRIEFATHKHLASFSVSRSYVKEGRIIECQELFSCDTNTAISVIEDILNRSEPNTVTESSRNNTSPLPKNPRTIEAAMAKYAEIKASPAGKARSVARAARVAEMDSQNSQPQNTTEQLKKALLWGEFKKNFRQEMQEKQQSENSQPQNPPQPSKPKPKLVLNLNIPKK